MNVAQGHMPLRVYPSSMSTSMNPSATGASSPVGAELLERKVQVQTSFQGSPIGHMERLDHHGPLRAAPPGQRDSSPLGSALMARKVERQSDGSNPQSSDDELPMRPPSLKSGTKAA